MKHDRYLGELGAALRLNLPDDRTAELVTEIAGHLDEVDGDPVAELGLPSELAKGLVGAEGASHVRRIRLGVTTAVLIAISLVGLILLFGGSPLDLSELAPMFMQAILIGLVSVSFGPQMRDLFRARSPKPIFMFLAAVVVCSMIGLFIQEQFLEDRSIDVPAARPLGAVLMVGGLVASYYVLRPLRFRPETGLKTDLLGRVRASK